MKSPARHRNRKRGQEGCAGLGPCRRCDRNNPNELLRRGACRLSHFKPGERGTILRVCGNPDLRLRLMEMGFVRGAQVKMVKYAPLTDPMEFEIMGYHVSLRKDQASDILMESPGEAA